MKTLTTLFLAIFTAAALASPRSSASYRILADTADSGGGRAGSASYTNVGTVGGIGGTASVAVATESAKSGYVGQLYEHVGLVVAATSATLDEGGTRQLAAAELLDDATTLALAASTVTWSPPAAPLTAISTGGLVTAGRVFQNTPANVQGSYLGFTGNLPLTVLNIANDDLSTYADDGLDDAWQVQYFGLPPNANAGPDADVSGTGQTNLFKYVAGLNPLDPNSRFTLKITPTPDPALPGQFLSGQRDLIFAPRFGDRTYTITARPALTTGSYVPLTNPSAPSDAGQQRTVTDLSAGGVAKFYRVEITKP